jgi:hypothetical protein
MRAGQVEFIAIIGILVVVIVAVYFGMQTITVPTAPAAIAEEQKLVQDSVASFIRAGANDVLRTMFDNGGYITTQANSVTFLGKQVPYWTHNGRTTTPDMRANFVQGMTSYLNENRAVLEQSLAAKNVTIGDPSVSATLMQNQIILTVNMPTSVKGYPIQQPYTVTIPTKLGEIDELAKALSGYLSQNRFLEYATLSSMAQTPLENDVASVPFAVLVTDCGGYVYLTWNDIKPDVERAVQNTLAHTYMTGKVPLDTIRKISSPKYALPALGGKAYSDLEVSFFTPDDWALDRNTMQFTPEPINAYGIPVEMSDLCYSDPIYVKYFLTYPTITVIKDPLTGNLFKYAGSVYIKDNAPGDWATIAGYVSTEQAEICASQDCAFSATVLDSSFAPVSGADITFMGCPLGTTGSDGRLSGSVPCGAGVLEANAGLDYSTYSEMKGTSTAAGNELDGVTIALKKRPIVNINFYHVIIANDTILNQYRATNVDYIANDEAVTFTMLNIRTGDRYSRYFTTKQGKIEHLDAVEYAIVATLSKEAPDTQRGMVNVESFILDEDTTELHVYVPDVSGFSTLNQGEKQAQMILLTEFFSQCGIEPVSEAPLDTDKIPCSKTHSELLGALEA